MVYRDPIEAARLRIERAREQVAEREQRITDALLPRLPKRLARRLRALRERADEEPDDLEGLGELERLLARYGKALDRAIESAPKLDRRFNRLPSGFPKRLMPRFPYIFPDSYEENTRRHRGIIHQIVRGFDSEAVFYDSAAGYFNRATPFVVEACFRFRDAPDNTAAHKQTAAPIRLHVILTTLQGTDGMGRLRILSWTIRYSLSTLLRPSTPRLELNWASAGRSLLKLLGIKRDVVVGIDDVDDAHHIDADPDDAKRLLTPTACEALMQLSPHRSVHLEVGNGLARLEYVGKREHSAELADAATVLREIRNSSPVPLYRRKRGSRRRR